MVDVSRTGNIAFSGNCLTPQETSALQVLCLKKRRDAGHNAVHFWGKISGTENDYVVCVGVQEVFNGLPTKKFYFSQAPFGDLNEIPTLSDEESASCAAMADQTFTGRADEPAGDGCTEAHRLAFAVGSIDSDCSIVPRGAYIVDASHQAMTNASFNGLSAGDAQSLGSYFHFRDPVKLPRKGVLETKKMVKATDFLDPINEDNPQGCWSLQTSENGQTVTLRSLLWPGYYFYHNIGTSDYGGAYFGDGRKNSAILFML
jgi:radial spoke head protein 9